MPATENIKKAHLAFVYTEIGRGHPFYLDGIIDALDRLYPDVTYYVTDVFKVSSGRSLEAWKLVRSLYSWGGRGGLITSLYGLLRRFTGSSDNSSTLHNILGRDLISNLTSFRGTVIVAHPVLARILSGRNKIVYQHGEMVVPEESVVSGCRRILVPTGHAARSFLRAGIAEENLAVTGQCIEKELAEISRPAFNRRTRRLAGDSPLTAALFSSGAYPRRHLDLLKKSAVSLLENGIRVYLFTGRSEKVWRRMYDYFRRRDIIPGDDISDDSRLTLVQSTERREENRKVAEIFANLDFFIAPAHERTNWSIGLGLPHFILGPHIGSYAPLNAQLALQAGVGHEISDRRQAENLGGIVQELRLSGKLKSMTENGFGKNDIDGFRTCAETILKI